MPNKHAIQQEILDLKGGAQDIVRRRYLANLARHTGRDTIVYGCNAFSAKVAGIPPFFTQITNEDLQGFMAALHGLKGTRLDLILHSGGGSLDAAELIVHYLRDKYQHIRAIVPMAAMSAATMIACACDEIVLARHSCIGPIDPQITLPTQNGYFTAPAFAILGEFNQAMADVQTNPNTAVIWGAKIKDYPPGILTMCQQFMQLAVIKVTQWLEENMLREHPNRHEEATRIAAWLGNAAEHKSHGRPITYDVARAHGLNVTLLEDDQALQERVLSFFHAMIGTFDTTNCVKFIENHKGKGFFYTVSQPQQTQA